VVNPSVRDCRVRVWRPILHPLPLTLLARLEYKP
jgi:hypothetical protein